ncbi:HpcH/HpaI aldolase/citrate lyase family protein [Falsiroseomonas sp.]|uniref:HpcH/HpaI aldolase/citrate lyase family protein n=1 Tax=Falsiroseomonas sp. TaxID=2870721 RepID=UPI003F72ACE0
MTFTPRAATWRSMLYVPANVPRFVAKAPASGADAIILDLEDSVPVAQKAAAREGLAEAVATCRTGPAAVLVRINRPLRLAVRDIEAAIACGVDGILVTKAMDAGHIRLIAEVVDDLEGTTPRCRLLPLIESASAIDHMAEIGAASPRVAGLLVGAEDLAAEIGCTSDDEVMVSIKRRMAVAAAQAGVAAMGTLGSIADFRDLEKLRDVVAKSRRAGFSGGSCIHPAVIPILNEGFSPSEKELDLARRQIAAAEAAEAEGRGSFEVDGRMVDEPILRRARRILASAR